MEHSAVSTQQSRHTRSLDCATVSRGYTVAPLGMTGFLCDWLIADH